MTSIEILAPYLPYGIEVEAEVVKDLEKRRAVLVGITHDLEDREPNERPVSVSLLQERSRWRWFPYSQVTPILRSFEDLVKPLEDGTVPAKELLLIIDKDRWAHLFKSYIKRLFVDGDSLMMEVDGAAYERESYTKLACLRSHIWGDDMKATAADYLRSKHFAVGLQPHQYIKK